MSALKLHLGCGERYLDGYVNVDFPPSEHSVQTTSPADELADITRLEYGEGTVAEVRLHHVFEHFNRPTALRVLIDWRAWLQGGGLLVIETPDFQRSARDFFLRPGRRGTTLRHVFGSHEAGWAVHWDGWYESRYRETLGSLGYGELRFEKASWRGTHNITVHARALGDAPPRERQLAAAERLLRESLVDDSGSELRLLEHWSSELRGDGSP